MTSIPATGRLTTRALALLLVSCVPLSGCAASFDAMYLLAGPEGFRDEPSALVETDPTDVTRSVRLDPGRGLVCEDTERPTLVGMRSTATSEHPNGWLGLAWAGTTVDFTTVVASTLVRELGCDQDCVSRERFYPWLIPSALSMIWGFYRSFTIEPEVLLSGQVLPATPSRGEAVYPCPAGTVIVLESTNARFDAEIGARGVMTGDLFAELGAFLVASASVELEAWSGGVRIDLEESARRTLEVRAASAAPPPPAPPTAPAPPPSRVSVEIEVQVRACTRSADCHPGDRCVAPPNGVGVCWPRL